MGMRLLLVVLGVLCVAFYANMERSLEADSTVVAYYQTNGAHPRAMERAIRMFKNFYPPENIHMHNDGGSPKLKSIAHVHGIRNYSSTVVKRSATKEGMYFSTPEAGADYLDRLAKTAEAAPWVLLLEDDVGLHGRIDTDQLKYDINGMCYNNYAPGLAKRLKYGCYGACGGMIVNSSRLLSANRTTELVGELIAIDARGAGNIASDELLAAVIILNGGTIGPYDGFTDKIYRPGMVTQHYKFLY